MTDGTTRVCVVGAGISGLTLAHRLRDADGVDVTVYESLDEPGGVVRSRRVDGRVLELGPQRLRLTPPVEGLVDELGLRDGLRVFEDTPPLYIYHDGGMRVAPLSARGLATTDLLSWRGKLRMLAEPLVSLGSGSGSVREGETVDGFLSRRFGREGAERLLGPLYSGLYGTDPDEMLAEYSLSRSLDRMGIGDGSILVWAARRGLSGTPPVCTLDGGLGRLSEALYEANRGSVRLGCGVTGISAEEARGYSVATDDGNEVFDEVVLTVPAPTAARLLEGAGGASSEALGGLSYNPIAMVYLESGYEGDGMGVLTPDDTRMSGMTWNSSLLGRDRLYTCFLDRGSYPNVTEADDERLMEVAEEDFESVTGAQAEAIHVHRWEPGMPAYDGSWAATDGMELPDGVHLCANYVGRPGVPGRIAHAERLAERLSEGSEDR